MVGECTIEDGADLNEIGYCQSRKSWFGTVKKEGGGVGKKIDRVIQRQGKIILKFDLEYGEKNLL